MFRRLTSIADRRDILLFAVLGVAILAFSTVWALFLYPYTAPFDFFPNTYFMTAVLIVFALLAALIPRFGWGRTDRNPRAAFMIRFGLALQIFGLLMTPPGLYFETNPTISVPIGFAAFTGVLLGVFVAGFGGNMVAPKSA